MILGWGQVSGAVSAPRTLGIVRPVDGAALAGRPSPLVLGPHPAGFGGSFLPVFRGDLFGGGDALGDNGFLLGNRYAQVGVVLLAAARLGRAGTGLVVAVGVVVWRDVWIVGQVG